MREEIGDDNDIVRIRDRKMMRDGNDIITIDENDDNDLV